MPFNGETRYGKYCRKYFFEQLLSERELFPITQNPDEPEAWVAVGDIITFVERDDGAVTGREITKEVVIILPMQEVLPLNWERVPPERRERLQAVEKVVVFKNFLGP